MLAYVQKITAHNVAVIRLKDSVLSNNKRWIKYDPTMQIIKVKCYGSIAEAGKVCLEINKKIKAKA